MSSAFLRAGNPATYFGLMKDRNPMRRGLSRHLSPQIPCQSSTLTVNPWRGVVSNDLQIEMLNALPRPWGTPQKYQARLDAGVMLETPDRNIHGHRIPANRVDQMGDHCGKCDAIQACYGRLCICRSHDEG